MFFSNTIEHVFFDLLIPKVKPISIGIFYRPPNANTFLETFQNDLNLIDFKKFEVYFLGNFNINLLLNNKFLLKKGSFLMLEIQVHLYYLNIKNCVKHSH